MSVSDDIERLLKLRTVAMVGCSDDPRRPSNQVARYLIEVGYRVIPVNPNHAEILGEKCYPDLASIREPIEVVDVFRRSESAGEAVDQAIAAKAVGVWLQDGVRDPEAEARARANGLTVVADDCIMRQHLSRMGR
ncbi:MAG: CoA-binding protein [Elusimicrobia bacterium]|nr:CoA-binding protein [Elusimicrobiota bacterium]